MYTTKLPFKPVHVSALCLHVCCHWQSAGCANSRVTGQLQRRQMQDGVKSELVPAKYEATSSEDEAPGASVLDYSQYYPTLLPFVPPDAETLNAAEPAEGQPDLATADEVQPRKVHTMGCF